jgi:hypothetical protein
MRLQIPCYNHQSTPTLICNTEAIVTGNRQALKLPQSTSKSTSVLKNQSSSGPFVPGSINGVKRKPKDLICERGILRHSWGLQQEDEVPNNVPNRVPRRFFVRKEKKNQRGHYRGRVFEHVGSIMFKSPFVRGIGFGMCQIPVQPCL